MYARAILLATAALAVFDKASALTSASNYAKSVSLPLDHFGTNKDVFKNRFWVYDEAYKPGGPVICKFACKMSLDRARCLDCARCLSIMQDVSRSCTMSLAIDRLYC